MENTMTTRVGRYEEAQKTVGDLQQSPGINTKLQFATLGYRSIRDRIRTEDPKLDEQTLADTVEGLTDLHQIIAAIIRAALTDEALATGLKGRIAEMRTGSNDSRIARPNAGRSPRTLWSNST